MEAVLRERFEQAAVVRRPAGVDAEAMASGAGELGSRFDQDTGPVRFPQFPGEMCAQSLRVQKDQRATRNRRCHAGPFFRPPYGTVEPVGQRVSIGQLDIDVLEELVVMAGEQALLQL